MPITFIHLENFKSFEKLSLDLKDINIFIGANASGKSNFLQIFRFIKNLYKLEFLTDSIILIISLSLYKFLRRLL